MTDNTINNDMTMGGATGALLAGRYRVVRQLGQGGMGSVWLAEDEKLDGFKVAIKMLPSVLVNNKRAYAQVKAEALVSLKLSHPNIATVRAFEEESGSPFLVMDYIDGQTLDDYLAEKGKLSEGEAIRLLKPVAAALDYAHAQGVVHRDVKPGNVMIRKDGTPFVLDFGIAREIQETMTRVTGKLSSGTLLYMSPEQLNGAVPKPAQDVYSFAAMVYECLTGAPPFSRGQIEHQIEHNNPERLPVNIAICHGVMAGLEKLSEKRPVSCAAVLTTGATSGGSGVSSGRSWSVSVVSLLMVAALVGIGGSWAWRVWQKVETTCQTEIARQRDEAHRVAEERHKAEEKRLAEEKRIAEEEKRLAEERRVAEERRKAEEERLAEEKRIAEERRAAEEERKARDAAAKAETERRRAQMFKAGGTKTITLPGGATMEMVWCPPGSFMMGSPMTEVGRRDDETPHRVTLTEGFWIGRYEVTQKQWVSVMGVNPSIFKGADHPVENISWDDCQKFIEKINVAGQATVALPTEAQWEYACRAGTASPFNFGSVLNGDKANCDGNHPYGTTDKGRCRQSTSDVGSYAPNVWGLYDMHGNVWEWCWDWYGKYPSGNATDPTGPASGGSRVFRGGS